MTLIQGLHGVVALVVLCSVLFAEEAGVPMPISGEFMLIAGGVLVGTGALDPWLFLPLAIVCSIGGAFTGYSWARLVGEHGLRTAAERVNQGHRLTKVTARIQRAGTRSIALSRLTPGLRVYTSLVAGAAGVDRRRFLAGVGPLTAVWVIAFTVLGALVGVPASRLLTQLQDLVLQGGLLIVIGVGAYLAVRRIPRGGRTALARLPDELRVVLAVAVDMALIATVVAGVLAIVGGVLAIAQPRIPFVDFVWWVELLTIVAVIGVFYSVATRRGLTATAGETLLATNYLTHGSDERGRIRLKRLLQVVVDQNPAPPADLVRMSAVFRPLADPRHLQVVRLLLEQDASRAELMSRLELDDGEAGGVLGDLEEARLVVGVGEGANRHYTIASDQVKLGLAELLAHATSA